jgi:predicted ATPase/DNA-binding XRE family transcriptional regulator
VSDASLAEQLRHHRAAARLTQAELGARAGISERAVSDIERNLRARVYPVTAQALADALGLTDGARVAFETAAQAGRTARHGRESSTSAPSAVAGSMTASSGTGDWRAMQRTPMVGRNGDLEFLLRSLRDDGSRLHTITGPGGMGKSRLAADVCEACVEGGVIWVSLAAVRQPEFVTSTIAAAAGLPRDAAATSVAAALDNSTRLLVLDTFEHVRAAANEVASLLDFTSRLRVLVTSRAPLRVRGERELLLRPLPPAAAIELFQQRVLATRPDMVVDAVDAATAIEDIVRRLSGLPLALELAAAKVRHLSLAALRSRVDHPLELLDDGERDLPQRQQTMRSTIAWSYDLLPPVEQRLFPRLGVFVDGWTLEAAAGVCTGDDVPATMMMSALGRLCEHGLVQPDDAAAERWRLLDPIRDFALERLEATGERAAIEGRHARVFAELTERAAARLLGPDQTATRAELRADIGNVRLALTSAIDARDADTALCIAGASWMFWRMESAFTEGRHWLRRALELPSGRHSPRRLPALWGAAWLAYQQGDRDTATAYGEELLANADGATSPVVRRNGLTILGHLAVADGRADEAVPLLQEALDLARAAGLRWHVASSLLNLGTALLHRADYQRARQVLGEAVAAHEAAGDQLFAARSRVELGYAALVCEDLGQARSCFGAALTTFVEFLERWGMAEAVAGVAVLAAARRDAETAALLTGASEATYAEVAAQFLAEARRSLGDRAWIAALDRGRGLSIEQAATIALDYERD